MSVPPTLDLQGLLAEDQWMRRLARSLAGDAQTAEDLVQETWLAALDPRARPPRRLRPWLRGILRHLWIDRGASGRARVARERGMARDEALGATDELVAELELRKSVAEALLALEEPYRAALTLRFFQDQSLAAIARRQGISVTRAHERVQEGLARLRARLDGSHGGRREAWAGGLLVLARPAGFWKTALEAAAMASGWKLAATVVGLGGGLLWFLAERGPETAQAEPAQGPAVAEAVETVRSVAEPLTPLSVRTEVATSPEAEPQAPAVLPVSHVEIALFHGRVVDPMGVAVPSVAVGWKEAPAEPSAPVHCGLDGSFALPLGTSELVHCLEPDLVTLVPASCASLGQAANALVVVAPRADVAGVVVDPEGAPVAGAHVAFRVRDVLYRDLGLPRGEHDAARWQTESDPSGAFALDGVAGGERVVLEVRASGFMSARVELPVRGARDLVVRLEHGHEGWRVHGIVLDPHGVPFAGARVSASEEIVRSDEDGRFEVGISGGPGTFYTEPDGLTHEDTLPPGAQLIALADGFAPACQPLAEIEPEREVVLRLGAAAETIAGRVLDPGGEPLAGIVVWVGDPTDFGVEKSSASEGITVAWKKTVEDELAGGYGRRGVVSDAEGRFTLPGLLSRVYALSAFRPATAELAGPFAVRAGTRGVELVFAPEEPRGLVAGHLSSVSGAPLAGVTILVRRLGNATGAFDSAYAEPPSLSRTVVTTDAEGRFSLGEIALARTELLLQDPRLFIRTVALADFPDPANLELVEPLLCELQIDASADPSIADHVRVLDAEGHALETIETFGNAWSMDSEAALAGGRSSLLYVRETAATLVLLRGESEVLRRPLRLDPGARTTVRP